MTQDLGLKTQEKYLLQVDELQIIMVNVRDELLQWISKYLNPIFKRKIPPVPISERGNYRSQTLETMNHTTS